MNATPPVSQTPIASDPGQQSAAAAANSVNSGGKGQDFAAELCNAGPKPARKAAGAKPADAGSVGGQLPAAGNLSPPPTPPAAAGGAAAAAAAGTVGGAPKPGAAAGTAAPEIVAATAPGSPAVAMSGAQAVVADQNPGSAPVDSPIAAPGTQGATSPDAGVTAPGVAAPAKGAATAAGAGSAARAGATVGTAAGPANKPVAVVATAPGNAATSAPTGTTDGSTTESRNTAPPTNTDASAQAVAAAAVPAAASGPVEPDDAGVAHAADLTSSPADELATRATAARAKGAGAPNGPPPPASASSVVRPAAAVPAKAAAAAPAVATLAGAGSADKRASGDSPLSGSSVDGAAGAAQLSSTPTGVADATPTPPPTLKVAPGVDTPEFGHGLAERVSWMVDNNLNGAKLQVNPPQLGPIEVRIAVQGSHAQVWLTSHSAVTRDALESSSPKLREMLGAQGFGQVSVDISQRSYQDRSAHSQPYESMPSAGRSQSTAAVQSAASSLARISSGVVDAYA